MRLTRILLLLILLCTGQISASPYFSFKKYQVEDGLSHNTVWCAMQDSYGFIWLGTSDGLNRYDGRGNKVYRNVLNDKFSLENNFVEALIEVDGNIWVGTNSGLYIYDRGTDRFSYFDKTTQYGVSISSEIKKIVKAQNGLLWIARVPKELFWSLVDFRAVLCLKSIFFANNNSIFALLYTCYLIIFKLICTSFWNYTSTINACLDYLMVGFYIFNK